MPTLDAVAAAAAELSPDDRWKLIDRLLDSCAGDDRRPGELDDPGFRAELTRRQSSAAAGIPYATVREEMRRR